MNSPVALPSERAAACNSALFGSTPGTMVFNTDANTMMIRSNNAVVPNTGNDIYTLSPTSVTTWDWLEDYRSTTASPAGYVNTYDKGRNFSPWQFAPTSNTVSGPLPILYEEYVAPHSGYVTAVNFRFGQAGPTNPALRIRRSLTSTIQRSQINLYCRIISGGTPTDFRVGTMLNGPTSATVTSNTNVIYNFAVSPTKNLIYFQRGDTITYRVKFDRTTPIDQCSINVGQIAPSAFGTVAGAIGYYIFHVEG